MSNQDGAYIKNHLILQKTYQQMLRDTPTIRVLRPRKGSIRGKNIAAALSNIPEYLMKNMDNKTVNSHMNVARNLDNDDDTITDTQLDVFEQTQDSQEPNFSVLTQLTQNDFTDKDYYESTVADSTIMCNILENSYFEFTKVEKRKMTHAYSVFPDKSTRLAAQCGEYVRDAIYNYGIDENIDSFKNEGR